MCCARSVATVRGAAPQFCARAQVLPAFLALLAAQNQGALQRLRELPCLSHLHPSQSEPFAALRLAAPDTRRVSPRDRETAGIADAIRRMAAQARQFPVPGLLPSPLFKSRTNSQSLSRALCGSVQALRSADTLSKSWSVFTLACPSDTGGTGYSGNPGDSGDSGCSGYSGDLGLWVGKPAISK